jgi:sterol desaturase/sphingolipid hydroxylase (fatty acid hydroxylase superfamily)
MNWENLNSNTSDIIILFAIPFYIITIIIEGFILYKTQKENYDLKDAAASITMGLGSAVINGSIKTIVLIIFYAIYQFKIFDLGYHWWMFILLFFADDFSFYLHHRSCHQIRLFWAAHVNHHSSTNYNFAIALRQSWGELFHKYIWWAWMPLVGFNPILILCMMSISLIYQYFLHTEIIKKLGFIEKFMNTPSHHRVHHAVNTRYLDRNHGAILIIWDKFFGTFQEELDQDPVIFGITTNINTYNPLKIASHEYINLWQDVKKAPGIKNKLKYMFMPPGWSHDGSTKTSNDLRREQNIV